MGEATLAAVFRAVASFDAPEHELLRLETEARRAWPDLTVPTEAFVAHLARHAGSQAALATVHVADLFLAFAVASHDRAALSVFEERYLSHVPDYVVRVRAGKHTVDEIVQKVREMKDEEGFNALTDTYENLVQAGVIDPAKVVRNALQNSSSIASLLLTTEALICEIPEEKKEAPAMPGGGGMGGMGGMGF